MSTVSPVVCSVAASLACLLLAAGVAHADDERAPGRNIVTTNPVRYAVLHVQVEYERVAARHLTWFVAPIAFYHDTWYPFGNHPGVTARGLGLDFGARYVFGDAPAGVFVGPYLSAYRAQVFHDDQKSLDGYVFSLGAQAGYTLVLGRWLLSAGGGLSYGLATDQAPDGSVKAEHLPHRGSWLNLRSNVGLVF